MEAGHLRRRRLTRQNRVPHAGQPNRRTKRRRASRRTQVTRREMRHPGLWQFGQKTTGHLGGECEVAGESLTPAQI